MKVAADAAVRCYGLRRVNPFLGTLMVVRTPRGRALSSDGRHWQLQVATYPPRGLWSGEGHSDELRWFRFGYWSEAGGRTDVPVNPILDVGSMLDAAEGLTVAVADAQARLPFALMPELELWQMDRDDSPLVMLATATETEDRDAIGTPAWRSGDGERRFRSATLAAEAVRCGDDDVPDRHTRELEQMVAQAAANPPVARWIRRSPDGGGCLLDLSGGDSDPCLDAASFPSLCLREQSSDARYEAVVHDYLDWLAPYLLMLPGLAPERRAALERAAVRQALLVERCWRLFPAMIEVELLRRARVEARLRAG